MVDLNGHEAGNGGHSQGNPTAYRDSSTRRDVLNRVSDNVGGVKQFSSTLQHALVEERHFALVEAVAFALPTKARS